MKILHRDLKHGVLKVRVANLDDLWTLYNVIRKGDVVHAKTTREVKMDKAVRPSSKRVSVALGVRVRNSYFDREVNRLRIHGIVALAPEDLDVTGSHHTLDVAVDDAITIVKEDWLGHELERVEKSVQAEDPVIIVGVDSDEACVAVLRSYGLDIKAEIPANLPGKNEPDKREQASKKYFAEIAKTLQIVLTETSSKILIVGPGFSKDTLHAYLKENFPEISRMVWGARGVSAGGRAGVEETTRVGVIGKVMRETRAAREILLVEEVMRRLGRSTGDVSYGFQDVGGDAAVGAIASLLICDEKLRSAEGEERVAVDSLLKGVEERGGVVTVISAQHEGGKKLLSLGGVAALLRYARHLRQED